MNIKRMIEEDNRIGNFINGEFLSYAEQNNVDLNYNEFCFIAESDDGEIVGVLNATNLIGTNKITTPSKNNNKFLCPFVIASMFYALPYSANVASVSVVSASAADAST